MIVRKEDPLYDILLRMYQKEHVKLFTCNGKRWRAVQDNGLYFVQTADPTPWEHYEGVSTRGTSRFK